MSLDIDLVVEVFVPTSADGKRGEIATGYPVSPDLILTTGHVFRKHREPHKVAIRWLGQRNRCAEPEDAWDEGEIGACLCWRRDDDELDAALLRFPCYDKAKRTGALAHALARPETGADWEGAAFPSIPKKAELREPITFSGKTHKMASTGRLFQVGVEYGFSDERHWPGASGMAVFAGPYIVGVVKGVPEPFEAQRLDVVPHWKLLQDPCFRRQFEAESATRPAEVHAGKVRELLQARKPMANALADALALSKQRDVDALMSHLRAFDEAGVIKLLVALKEGIDGGKIKDVEKAELVDFALALLPVVADPAVELRLRTKSLEQSEFVDLPLFHNLPLEVAMAAADGQPAALCPCSKDGEFPAGDFNVLPLPVEPGDVDVAIEADEVFRVVALKMGLDLEADLSRYTPQQQDKLVSLHLARRERAYHRRYYLTQRLSHDRSNLSELGELARAIRERLKSVVLIALEDSFDARLRDEETYLDLCLMLPVAGVQTK